MRKIVYIPQAQHPVIIVIEQLRQREAVNMSVAKHDVSSAPVMPPGVGRQTQRAFVHTERVQSADRSEFEPSLSHYRVGLNGPRSEISVADGDHVG